MPGSVASGANCIIGVNLLHVSVTFCGHLQGGIFTKDTLKRQPKRCINITYYNLNTWYMTYVKIWDTDKIFVLNLREKEVFMCSVRRITIKWLYDFTQHIALLLQQFNPLLVYITIMSGDWGLLLPVQASFVYHHLQESTVVLLPRHAWLRAPDTHTAADCICTATATTSAHCQHRRWRYITHNLLNQTNMNMWVGRRSMNENNAS